MLHKLTNEFRDICQQILDQDWTELEWASHESDDWFVSGVYEGGFDATEKAFCFAYVSASMVEYWFQVRLRDVQKIASGEIREVECRAAE